MFFVKLPIGTKDALLGIACFLMLILTIVYHWSPVEFFLTEGAVVLAFFAGTKKQDKWAENLQGKKHK